MVSFKGRRPTGRPMGKPMGKKKPSKFRKPFKKKARKKLAQPAVVSMDSTGLEALYLKTLMEEETPIVVVLTSGEKIRGYVKYYDKDTFSFGPADGSPKLFVRKTGVRYLYEEPLAEIAEAEEAEESEEELIEAVA
jgi:hypothetical protein